MNVLKEIKNNFSEEPAFNAVLTENTVILCNKIAVITSEGYTFVEVNDIIRCEADGRHTIWFLSSGRELRSTQILKSVEQKLSGYNFHRIHHAHLINVIHIDQYTKVKGAGGILVLSNGENVKISNRKKISFLKKFTEAAYQELNRQIA